MERMVGGFGDQGIWVLECWGLRFRVWGLGFGVWGLGVGGSGLGFGVWGLGFVYSGYEGIRALKHSGHYGLRVCNPDPYTMSPKLETLTRTLHPKPLIHGTEQVGV